MPVSFDFAEGELIALGLVEDHRQSIDIIALPR
jgi:hypothetical protein